MIEGETIRHPLKVLMTADAVGGVWSYALALCGALPQTRFVLATMGPRPSRAQRREVERLRNVVLAESDHRLEWMAGGGTDFPASRDWLAGLAERHDVDLVHVNGYAHADLGVERPVLVVAHSDVQSWWEAVRKRPAPPEWDAYIDRVAAGLTAATRVVTPTASVLGDLQRHYVRLQGRAEVIPNGIDLAAFSLLSKRPVVAGAGRLWDAAKNLTALEAVAPGLDWPVEIAGDVEHPESGTASFVNARLVGRLSSAQMARQLGATSIFVAPALYEPFGLAVLEAAAAGCALVLGDIPSLRENWDGAALFVDPEDRPALRSTINRLIANVGERVRLAMSARCRALNFPLNRMARAYGELYRDLTTDCHSGTARGAGPGTHEHRLVLSSDRPVFIGSGLADCARAPE